MAGGELSYSEYLKCKNASVKVTINRYSQLCSATLREKCDAILEKLKRPGPTNTALICLDFSMKLLFFGIVNVEAYHCILTRFHRLHKDTRHDSRYLCLRLAYSLILHNFIFPLLKRHYHLLPQFTQQDFEPETIDHGSGFLIADNFVITSWHVIEEAMRDETLVIRILNETFGELPCVVVHCDPSNDLALLYCDDVDLKRHEICPFALSEEGLWPSLPVFSFGYPLTHTEESALFVKGYVSGLKKRYGDNRKSFWVLNCDLNAGNSGGPVLRRTGDDIKVVGVVAQKHKKQILTLEELNILEEERSTLQMNSASDSRDQFWKLVSLKMYDALNETHCQFGYGNVVPGHLLAEFLHDPSVMSMMDCVKEMALLIEKDLRSGLLYVKSRPRGPLLTLEVPYSWYGTGTAEQGEKWEG